MRARSKRAPLPTPCEGAARSAPHPVAGIYVRTSLRPNYALAAIGFGAGVGHVIALAVETDDEHGASVSVAGGLVGGQDRRISALGRGVADALAEAAMAELVGAAEEFDGKVGVIGSEYRFHGAIVLVAKGQDVRPHAKRV